LADQLEKQRRLVKKPPTQYYVLVTCNDEKDQVRMLERFVAESVECRAIVG
jgi:hypothetical protein